MVVDFTNCERINSHTYNGANGKKIAVKYNDEIYMLKFPSVSKNENLSYSNSVFSEYISCHIYEMMGFNTQKTILGKYDVDGKEKITCACKDFTTDTLVLQDFASIKNTIIDSETNGYGTELSEILETIDEQQVIDRDKLKDFFWDMFVADSFLANFDRHNGNWGFLYDRKTDIATVAPIYDCGSCLFPQGDDELFKKQLEDKELLEQRVYVFPQSAIKINDKKINPYQYINSLENKDLNSALLRIFPKINLEEINNFIDSTPIISKVRKEYYKRILKERYEIILKAAYDKLVEGEEKC